MKFKKGDIVKFGTSDEWIFEGYTIPIDIGGGIAIDSLCDTQATGKVRSVSSHLVLISSISRIMLLEV